MDVLKIGPLALPVDVLLLLFSFGLALFVSKRVSTAETKQATEDWLWRLLVGTVLAARLGFVAQYPLIYAESPLSFLDIRDGGFDSRFGLAFLAVAVPVLLLHKSQLQRPLSIAAITASALWFGMGSLLQAMAPQKLALPTHTVHTLQGTPVDLSSLKGRPVVINLWATWCPPCRREMPVFQQAQKQYDDVVFLFVNQGEDAGQVMNYLQQEGLLLNNLTLDPSAQLGKLFEAPGLPTTLFFNASGQQVDRRMGELSHASLLSLLEKIRETVDTE